MADYIGRRAGTSLFLVPPRRRTDGLYPTHIGGPGTQIDRYILGGPVGLHSSKSMRYGNGVRSFCVLFWFPTPPFFVSCFAQGSGYIVVVFMDILGRSTDHHHTPTHRTQTKHLSPPFFFLSISSFALCIPRHYLCSLLWLFIFYYSASFGAYREMTRYLSTLR